MNKPLFRQTGASVMLDAMRSAAAILVLLDHCKNLFFVDRTAAMQASSHPHLLSALYPVASAGPQAVVLFLVLSGYLIGGSILRSVRADRWSWKNYLTHRFVRLWLVLLPALVLCAGWDAGRVTMAGVCAHTFPANFFTELAGAGVTWRNFWGNVFFLQTVRLGTFGSDRVLWSLAAEFWYYILFPLGFFAVRQGKPFLTRCLYGAGFLLVAAFVGRGMLGLFPVWLCGAFLAMLRPPSLSFAGRAFASLLYLPFFYLFIDVHWPWRLFKMDHALGITTALFLWVMLSDQNRVGENAVAVRLSRSLAGTSYSLYLVHYPMLKFFAQWLAPTHWRLGPGTLAAAAAFMALAVLYGYGLAACTEWHNDRVRPWIESQLRRVVGVAPGRLGTPARAATG